MAKSKSRKSNQKSFSRKKTISNKRRSRKNTHLKIMKGGSATKTYVDIEYYLIKLIYNDTHGNYISFIRKERKPKKGKRVKKAIREKLDELEINSEQKDLFEEDFIDRRIDGREKTKYTVGELYAKLEIIQKFIQYKINKIQKQFDFKLKLSFADDTLEQNTNDKGDEETYRKTLNENIFQFIKFILQNNEVSFNYKILDVKTVKEAKPFNFSIKIEIFDIKKKKEAPSVTAALRGQT